MQKKVSIIIPCYNKAAYIDRMFQSICVQKWDNVEVILSCRKSEDGTDEKIDGWIPKLLERGFSVVRIYGENTSLPTGTLSALKRVTGEYVALLAADDYISDDYLSLPVEFLESNKNYQYTIADMIEVGNEGITSIISFWRSASEQDGLSLEAFVLHAVSVAVVRLIVRKSYIDRTMAVEKFDAAANVDVEAQLFLPYIAGGGEYKYLPRLKYFFDKSQADAQISNHSSLDGFIYFTESYGESVGRTLLKLDLEESHMKKLLDLNELTTAFKILTFAIRKEVSSDDPQLTKFIETAYNQLKCNWSLKSGIHKEDIYKLSAGLHDCIVAKVIRNETRPSISPTGRIIACGCLGQTAKKYLPYLFESNIYKPDILWDKAVTYNEEYCGSLISKPDYQDIKPEDTIFVLIDNAIYKNGIMTELKNAGAENIYDIQQIRNSILMLWILFRS